MITCYIVDDEKHSIEGVVKNIEKFSNLQVIGYNTNPLLALTEIQESHPDIIFLDVEMPELSGIDVARNLSHRCAIIIITGYVKHAHEAFDVDAVDFLFKPHTFERFVKAIRKAEDYLQKLDKKNELDLKGIFVNSNIKGKVNQVIFSKILYIEALDHTLHIHTESEKFTTRATLKSIENNLPAKTFIRVHRSFIINIDYLTSFDGAGIIISTDKFIPFGEMYKQSFKDKISLKAITKTPL